ncbi:MAG: hypothetical protein PT957_03970, partial [Firmicutes bacterium]|nr:hypothetical protein [Bacillota bacterium]
MKVRELYQKIGKNLDMEGKADGLLDADIIRASYSQEKEALSLTLSVQMSAVDQKELEGELSAYFACPVFLYEDEDRGEGPSNSPDQEAVVMTIEEDATDNFYQEAVSLVKKEKAPSK